MAPCDAKARIAELEAKCEEYRNALEQIAFPVGAGRTAEDALRDAFDRIVLVARSALGLQ